MQEIDLKIQVLNMLWFSGIFGVLYIIYYLTSLLAPGAKVEKYSLLKVFVLLGVFYIFVATAILLLLGRVDKRDTRWFRTVVQYLTVTSAISVVLAITIAVTMRLLKIDTQILYSHLLTLIVVITTITIYATEWVLHKHKYLKH